ncbi:inactive pancreatic lipase-related protein 1-like [Takifugu rubripes]|uniref:Triacylglycerol lipase n=2 Tax=Takifugu rubripes TaxID=31033 RepID=A0A674MAG7_TAKRU|nr:inactive pancreatic lipase-related protein 1-like [Takifugu rubripes]
MNTMWSLSVFCLLVSATYATQVCFEGLGCFADGPPWGGTDQRPVSILPSHPDEIGTRFLLFTQRNRYYQEIMADETVEASNYSGMRTSRFILPGYLLEGDEDWPQRMCKEMVKRENVNCIAVEWKKGVKTRYAQAANNIRVVAAQVAAMITFLMDNYKQTAGKFHMIGHSLGAHAAGDVGSRIPGLARITGLDPSEPYFQGTSAAVSLDVTDANFVDVIHTDGLPFDPKLGLGMSQSVGHIDFYPNGGQLMPGCSTNRGDPSDLDAIWLGDKKFDACNHVRAYEYYIESLEKPQGFMGYPCPNKDSFADGKCFPCGHTECPLMGHRADRFTGTEDTSITKYFLTTGSKAPFRRYSYRVSVTLAGPILPNVGFMFVALVGKYGSTKEHQLHVGTLISGRTYELLLDAQLDVGDVTEVQFRWNNHIIDPLRPKFGAEKVVLQRGKDKEIRSFCGRANVAENEVQSVLLCEV